jgi:hypothetical protein
MIASLRAQFPALPDLVMWKTELLFRGVRFTEALAEAVIEGAAPNFWPYRKRDAAGEWQVIQVPYLFKMEGGAVARVRADDRSELEVRRDGPGGAFTLWNGAERLCGVGFVRAHAWQSYRTSDGIAPSAAGVEQLGDMLVVNVAPGCEYFTVRDDGGQSRRCSFCGYGRFDRRSQIMGQERGRVELDSALLGRLEEVLRVAADSGEARHVYLTGGSLLGPIDEARRYLPIIETARRAVGDRLRVTCGSGAVDPADSRRFRSAGADSCCYNLEVWDADTFRAVCPGKHTYTGRERWIEGLLGAVEAFGRGNVGSAFVAGVELLPPAPGMSRDRMFESITEGAAFLLDRGIIPVYSPLWPVEGTGYGVDDGLTPELYVGLEYDMYRLRAARTFAVPRWLICPDCSYMLLEVDFDRAFGLIPGDA